jgi:uncharacterized protein (TIGR02284 family)
MRAARRIAGLFRQPVDTQETGMQKTHDISRGTAERTVPSAAGDVDALNVLLRGEISAVETYTQGINKFSDPADRTASNVLTRLRDEHTRSVETLRSRIVSHGGTPSDGSGVWGAFTTAVEGAAKLIGPQTALAALKQGEQIGLDDYESALKKEDVSTEFKFLIRNELMPRCQEHIKTLDQLIQQLEQKGGK